jgi:hypothetical protein
MDNDPIRRGAPSVHVALSRHYADEHLGASAAILAGDLLSALVHDLVASVDLHGPRRRALAAAWGRMEREVILGQCLDVTHSPDIQRIHDLKTGSYTVRGPMLLGAAIAGASEDARAAIDWRSIAVTPGAALVAALDALASPAPSSDTTHAEGELPPIDVPPGDTVVDAWIREGRLHAYVQGHAARDPDFAEELTELVRAAIDDQREDRTLPVGFAARRWLQRAQGGTARFEAPVPSLHRLAAATGDQDTSSESIDLGFLAPLAATARVDYNARSATLSVFADPGALASVRWGGALAESLADGTWRATIALARAPMEGEVTAADGTRCVFEVLAVAPS